MKNINIHSVVILLMVLGSFGDLAKVGVGGYLGRLLPELVE